MSKAHRILSRRSFFGLQVAALSATLAGCAHGGGNDSSSEQHEPHVPRSLDDIRSSGTIRVGLYSDNKPLSFPNSKGNYGGIDGYFCSFLIEHMPLAIDYVAVDPPTRYDMLSSGAVDLCLAEMSPSDACSGSAAFTRPVFRLQLGIASRSSSTIETAEQLAQGDLVVCAGTYAEQYAEATWPEVTLRRYQTLTDACNALKNNRGVALVADEICLSSWVRANKDFILSMKGIGDPRYIAPATAEGQDELVSLVDDIVSKFISGGYSRTGYEKNVQQHVSGDYSSMLCKNDEVAS